MIAGPQHDGLDLAEWRPLVGRQFGDFLRRCRSRRIRSMGDWAEDEIILPTGPKKDFHFRRDYQPFTWLWFDAIESGYWYDFCATGPSQIGKSLACFVIPILYHLFERNETVGVAVTSIPMAKSKWHKDLEPVIDKSRYRSLVPKFGSGSRGGIVEEITFLNGATLKFFTTGGDDKSRAYFTAPVLAFTEIDAMAQGYATSSEANPISQIEARARSETYTNRRIYRECTPTYEDGYIWEAITKYGSAGRILLPCPHCGEYVDLGRESLTGWQQAQDEIDVETNSAFACSDCGKTWTEEQRKAANQRGQARLVHGNQTVDRKGNIVGDMPRTRRLGFRFGPAHNMFLKAADIGRDEWLGRLAEDEADEEKRLCQFVWGIPYDPGTQEVLKLKTELLEKRRITHPKGVVPDHTFAITVGLDVGLDYCHWVAVAWVIDGAMRRGVIFDYGRITLKMRDAKSKDLGFEITFPECVGEWREGVVLPNGWPDTDGNMREPDLAYVDVRYEGGAGDTHPVYETIRMWKDKRWRPLMGFGSNQWFPGKYRPMKSNHKSLRKTGHHYHEERHDQHKMDVVKVDVDKWKAIRNARLAKSPDEPGALVIYDIKEKDAHYKFWRHVTAEVQGRQWVRGKGWVEVFDAIRKGNDWGDALTYAVCAGHRVGFRVNPPPQKKTTTRKTRQPTMPDGRPYLVTQR